MIQLISKKNLLRFFYIIVFPVWVLGAGLFVINDCIPGYSIQRPIPVPFPKLSELSFNIGLVLFTFPFVLGVSFFLRKNSILSANQHEIVFYITILLQSLYIIWAVLTF
jgi:hypothetical protein